MRPWAYASLLFTLIAVNSGFGDFHYERDVTWLGDPASIIIARTSDDNHVRFRFVEIRDPHRIFFPAPPTDTPRLQQV